MIDSIYVALSGMLGHERGLNVIGNNVTNMNTLGFRGSSVNFADVFVGARPNGQDAGPNDQRAIGGGVDASRTTVDFRSGTPQNTGGDLDAALQGEGFFIVQDESGAIRYTRAGSFDFVDDQLVLQGQKIKVMTRDANGQLLPISLQNLHTSAGKATGTLTLSGNFQPDDAEHTIDSVDVFDNDGKKHTLKLTFTAPADNDPTHPLPTRHLVVSEQGEDVGSVDIEFVGAGPSEQQVPVHLALPGNQSLDVQLDLSAVTFQPLGSTESNVAVSKQDGFAVGQITTKTFDEKGVLKLTYSNNQLADGPRLALAQFIDTNALVEVGNAMFEYRGHQPVTVREAGDDLTLKPRFLEASNVDLTSEFSQLILLQRGYQASSQVISTANDMLQELFDLRGRR